MTTTTLTVPSETTTPVVESDIASAHRPLAKYATEAIGTLFLVFTVGASVRSGNPLAPLAIGSVLMAMIYAGGHVSGAHYNPAVTVAVLVRGRITLRDAVGYWTAQLCGGLIGALLVGTVIPGHVAPVTLSGHAVVAALVVEAVATFALCFVVLNVATSKDHPNNSFYGLAIGFTVAACAVAVGSISGGAFNPAVAISGMAMGLFAGPTLWVYLVAELAAGVAAALAFRALNPTDR